MSTASANQPSPRADIQGLRAIAVIAVVLYHAKVPYFTGGYVGVDVFFVISGFLITGALVREIERSGRIDVWAFYARRIRRLLPAALAMLLAVAVAARIVMAPVEQRELAPAILFSALYASNIWFALQATDYLAGDVHGNPVLHMWSLAVEEQFYLLWPFLVVVAARLSLSLRRPITAGVTAVVCLVTVLSFVASIWVFSISRPWAFFLSPLRAWEFAAGGLTLVASAKSRVRLARHGNTVALVGLLLIALALVCFDDTTPFPSWSALLPVLGTCLVIAAGAGGVPRPLKWMRARIVQVTGDLSYSWYLWHWPVLVFPALTASLSGGARAGLVILSFVLAWATFHAIENPVRYGWKWIRVPKRSAAFGVLVTVVGATAAMALRASAKESEQLPEQRRVFAAREQLPSVYRDSCHADIRKVTISECAFGDVDSARTVFLIGDSHAAHWFPGIELSARKHGVRLVSLTKSACPVADVATNLVSEGRRYHECEQWRRAVLNRIEKERPALVLISHSSKYVRDPRIGVSVADWSHGMGITLAALSSSAKLVAVLEDTPWPGFDVPICLSRAYWRGQGDNACRFQRDLAVDETMVVLDRNVAARFPNVVMRSTAALVCPEALCESVVDGHIAYSDSHHISSALSRALGDKLLVPLLSRLDS